MALRHTSHKLLWLIYLSDNLAQRDSSGNITKSVTKTRMKPPLTKFRLGDLFGKMNNELLGFIESLSYSIPEESTWETEKGVRVPKFVTVNITYKVIHSEVPGLYTGDASNEYQFYGFEETFEEKREETAADKAEKVKKTKKESESALRAKQELRNEFKQLRGGI